MHRYSAGIILGILSAGLSLGALADEPCCQEPIVYEYDLKGPMTMESESIKTNSTIKSIYAYYEFEGEVRLEASANGGSTYAKIVNGSILKHGFIAGNELRFKAHIAENSILKKVVLGYEDLSGANRVYQNSDLTNYKKYKKLRVTGSEKELFNYPVKIEFGSQDSANSEHKAANTDIYFTAADGQTPLYYYKETIGQKAQDAGYVIYWVKVPQIPKQGTMIYVYYNSEDRRQKTEDRNNGKKVFLFFDDFNEEELDTEKYQLVYGLEGNLEIKDGYLRLRDACILTKDYKIKEGILEFKAKAEKGASIQAVIKGEYEYGVYSSVYPGAEHTIAINNMAKLNIGKKIEYLKDYIYKVNVNKAGIVFERYDEYYSKQAEIKFLDVGSIEGYIGVKSDSAPFNSGSAYFDWVRVRPYAKVEPEVKFSDPEN